jgi:hypothetical protein
MRTALVNPNVGAMPIVLRTTATIPPSGAGVTTPVTFDSTKVQNTLRVPIEISEILVTVFCQEDSSTTTVQPCSMGSGVELDLLAGHHVLTDGFIPFAVLAPWNSSDVGFSRAFEHAVTANGRDDVRTTRRIVLPQPIRLAPGVGFSGRTRRRPPTGMTSVTTGSQMVVLTLLGRAAPSGPRAPTMQRLPFWSHTRLALSSTTKTAESTEHEFRNPLSAEFAVERIIAAEIGGLTAAFPITTACTIRSDLVAAGLSIVGSKVFDPDVQLRWPNGDLLNTERALPASALFLRNWAYAHPFALAPNTRVRATVSQNVITYGYDFLMSLFGTRMEVL